MFDQTGADYFGKAILVGQGCLLPSDFSLLELWASVARRNQLPIPDQIKSLPAQNL
jgi:hypothetical protein